MVVSKLDPRNVQCNHVKCPVRFVLSMELILACEYCSWEWAEKLTAFWMSTFPYYNCFWGALVAVGPYIGKAQVCTQTFVQWALSGPCTASFVPHQRLLTWAAFLVPCWWLPVCPVMPVTSQRRWLSSWSRDSCAIGHTGWENACFPLLVPTAADCSCICSQSPPFISEVGLEVLRCFISNPQSVPGL